MIERRRQEVPERQRAISLRLPVGSIHRGAVKRIESYGAFVTLEGFSDGMVHVSQLSRSQRFYVM